MICSGRRKAIVVNPLRSYASTVRGPRVPPFGPFILCRTKLWSCPTAATSAFTPGSHIAALFAADRLSGNHPALDGSNGCCPHRHGQPPRRHDLGANNELDTAAYIGINCGA